MELTVLVVTVMSATQDLFVERVSSAKIYCTFLEENLVAEIYFNIWCNSKNLIPA